MIAAVIASDLEALGGAIGEVDTRAVDWPSQLPINSPGVGMGDSCTMVTTSRAHHQSAWRGAQRTRRACPMSDPFAGVDVRVSALGREIRTGTTQRGIHQHRLALRDANSSARRPVEVR